MRNPGWIAPAVWALTLGVAAAGSPSVAAARTARAATPAPAPASDLVTQLALQVAISDDNQGRPFMVIDKVAAEVFVYDADGDLKAAAPALLGLARGDDSAPGIGDKPLSAITPDERTTPAGRFMAKFGRDEDGEDVFWVDYGAAVSVHAVIKGTRQERRAQRLASPTPGDNRITYGCINVPVAFYRKVVRPTFGEAGGVVYILPEEKPVEDVFPEFALVAGPALADAGAAGSDVAALAAEDAPSAGPFSSAPAHSSH